MVGIIKQDLDLKKIKIAEKQTKASERPQTVNLLLHCMKKQGEGATSELDLKYAQILIFDFLRILKNECL